MLDVFSNNAKNYVSAIYKSLNSERRARMRVGGGGGEYLTNTGRLRPKLQPLTLLYTILVEKVPFLHTFIEKGYSFHIPN